MVFTVAILMLTTTSLDIELQRQEILRASRLEQRARLQLREAIPRLISTLERELLQPSTSSAFLPAAHSIQSVHQVAISKPPDPPVKLYSYSHDNFKAQTAFNSPVSSTRLLADYQQVSPQNSHPKVELAWTAEDISLGHSQHPPPAEWPFPGWNYSPIAHKPQIQEIPEPIRSVAPEYNSWIPASEALRFSPDLSPDLVPVVTSLSIRFGIFASGTSGTREKVVRIRYYLEGAIWNPYNRELRLHGTGSLQPAFSLAWQNLPELRIRNLSNGMNSGWISLDEVMNTRTGAKGLSGWIRAPGILQPGEVFSFSEPDNKYQPEGLARTIHPAFSVGPADHVILEFRQSETGSTAVCLMLDESQPVRAAANGKGWFAFGNVPMELPTIEFHRADDLPSPFYLHGGSLDFRTEHCQYRIHLIRPDSTFALPTDPRRKLLAHGADHIDASGNRLPEEELFDIIVTMGSEISDTNRSAIITPLFSWPERNPVSIIEYTDYTGWSQSYRLGSAGANAINNILNSPSIRDFGNSTPAVEVASASGEPLFFRPTFTINHVSSSGWMELLQQSIDTAQSGFHCYPFTSADRPDDFHPTTASELSQLGNRIAATIQTTPSTSVSEFFNRGLLTNPDSTPLETFLPLRGYFQNACPFRPYGSSWLLHLSIRISEDQISITRQARAWLQQVSDATGQQRFHMIRFEWVQ